VRLASGELLEFIIAVREAHLPKIIRVDLKAELFSYETDETARRLAGLMDGKLLLVTNTKDLVPADVETRYKALVDMERGCAPRTPGSRPSGRSNNCIASSIIAPAPAAPNR